MKIVKVVILGKFYYFSIKSHVVVIDFDHLVWIVCLSSRPSYHAWLSDMLFFVFFIVV